MSVALRASLCIAAVCAVLFLAACGSSSSGTHTTGQMPIFTSVPVTTAAQGQAYSYQLVATDPSGGTVSFALTTGPTGASMSGNTVNWTPTATQSRISNRFTVTATTSEGASGTQSWTVSPTGIVTVNWINTYWEPSGSVQVPAPSSVSLEVSAVVPQADGSITVLKGGSTAPGVISIPGVPAGNYWLALGGPNLLPNSSSAYWTGVSTFDAGHDIAGAPPVVLNDIVETTFDLNLSGLDSVSEQTAVLFQPENNSPALPMIDMPDSNSMSVVLGVDSNYDWSQIPSLLLAQYETAPLSSLSNAILGPSVLVTNPSFANGTTNTLTETLASSPTSYDVTIEGTQWAAVLNAASPAAPTTYAGAFSVVAEPYVTGRNASTVVNQPNIVLATTAYPAPPGVFVFPPFAPGCDSLGVPFVPASTPAVLTDQDLGTLSYSDPFDSAWTRAETLCQEALIPVAVPGSTATASFAVVASSTVPPPQSTLVPVVTAVENPTIASASFFTAATLTTTTPSLSWSAPATGAPYGYRVSVFVQQTVYGLANYAPAGVFYTSQTSVTLPPLSAGNSYVFAITALQDAAANIQSSPFRSQLPTGFASVISAPITISSASAEVQIHGDAGIVKQFSQPHSKTSMPALPSPFSVRRR